MKLYYYPGACSLAGHIVLEWTGGQYEAVRMSLDSLRAPWYLALNPSGSVPLLTDGDFSLTENVAILDYLAELCPAAGLLGDGTVRGRAEVLRWLAFLGSDVPMAFMPLFSPARFVPDLSLPGALANSARLEVQGHLKRLDAQLDGKNWLTGSRSIADPLLFVIARWAVATRVDLQGLGNLPRFVDLMHSDPGVRSALLAEEGRSIECGSREGETFAGCSPSFL